MRNGALEAEPRSRRAPVYVRSQGGLFDVALHPDFDANGWLYLSYAHGRRQWQRHPPRPARLDGLQLKDVQPIFTVNRTSGHPCNYGGRIAFPARRHTAVDHRRRLVHREEAQLLDNLFGKVVRLNDDGSIPADNPFVDAQGRDEIWTYGHRNPQGLALAPSGSASTTNVYLHEHGPRGGDELNLLQAGSNYGWPIATFGIDYTGAVISPFSEYPGTVQPLLHWTPSIAPAGMAWYGGDLFPQWRGRSVRDLIGF